MDSTRIITRQTRQTCEFGDRSLSSLNHELKNNKNKFCTKIELKNIKALKLYNLHDF